MAARFAAAEGVETTAQPGSYRDVARNGWAFEFITFAAQAGWVQGYPDGTFRPEAEITRAEVCTAVNRMLGRSADREYVEDHSGSLRSFADLSRDHWAYFEIAEAVNVHEFNRLSGNEVWEKNE